MSLTENLKYNESHNICAWLDADSNKVKEAPFVQVVQYIKNSNLLFAVSEDVEISERIIREFWSTARVIKEDESIKIAAKVDEYEVEITEEVIRRVLKLNDENGIEKLDQDYMVKGYQRLGYPADRSRKSIKKTILSGP